MINFGNISIADLRLGATQVQAAYLGNKQIWSLGPVVPKYDIQSIGRSTSEQGTSIEITEEAGETITLYIKTNASDLTGKQVCAAVYLNSTDVTPYASFAFSNVSLAGRYITGTTPDVITWVPSGFPETYSTLYMKTWIQDAGYIDPADALGEVLDWTGEEPPAPGEKPWLCFTTTTNSGGIRLDKTGSPDAVSLETSTDGTTWTDYSWNGATGDTITLANVGDKVYFRAKNENQTFSKDGNNCYKFSTSGIPDGTVYVSGNIQSLLKADCSRTDAPTHCFITLFDQCKFILDASGLQLPATTLADNCYRHMFINCLSLTSAPAVLPATIAPKPYYQMFYGCTSLTSAPEIMATTLGSYACGQMFYNCTSLATVPKLHATSISSNAMWGMFENCNSLSAVEVEFTDWSGATPDWLKNVSASGTFTCPTALGTDSTITRGASNCPTGWTVVNV